MIEHLSYSSISTYQICGKAWKYRYIDKVLTLKSPTLLLGSAVHEAVEELVRQQSLGISTEDFSPARYAEQTLIAKLEQEEIAWGDSSKEELFEGARRLLVPGVILDGVKSIRAKIDENGEPLIEKRVELHVPGIDIPIIGYIDIILDDGTPADFKTSSKTWTQQRTEDEKQPLFYLAAMGQESIPVNWKFKHFVMVKTKAPKWQVLEHSHEPKELFSLFMIIQEVWTNICKGVFMPAAPGSWKCSAKWCEFYDICKGR